MGFDSLCLETKRITKIPARLLFCPNCRGTRFNILKIVGGAVEYRCLRCKERWFLHELEERDTYVTKKKANPF